MVKILDKIQLTLAVIFAILIPLEIHIPLAGGGPASVSRLLSPFTSRRGWVLPEIVTNDDVPLFSKQIIVKTM